MFRANLWLQQTRKAVRFRYCIYVLVYAYDILYTAEDHKVTSDKLNQHFLLKAKSTCNGKPKIYLGTNIVTCAFEKEPGKSYFGTGSLRHNKESVRKVEAHLAKLHRELKSKILSPRPINCSPELPNFVARMV